MSAVKQVMTRFWVLIFLFGGLVVFQLSRMVGVVHLDSLVLTILIVATLIWSLRCRPTRENACEIAVFWICFSWILRNYIVGISGTPGGFFRDLDYLSGRAVSDDYFPAVFSSITIYATILIAVPLLGLIALVLRKSVAFRIAAGGFVILSLWAVIHQYGLGNQMATTTFWVGLFMVWLLSMKNFEGSSASSASLVSQIIVSFIFFGAVIGKLTPEYWHNQVTGNFGSSPNSWGRIFPQYLGMVGILGEATIATTFLLVPRIASVICLLCFLGMFVSVGPTIIDAVGPVLGLCLMTQVLVRIQPEEKVFDS